MITSRSFFGNPASTNRPWRPQSRQAPSHRAPAQPALENDRWPTYKVFKGAPTSPIDIELRYCGCDTSEEGKCCVNPVVLLKKGNDDLIDRLIQDTSTGTIRTWFFWAELNGENITDLSNTAVVTRYSTGIAQASKIREGAESISKSQWRELSEGEVHSAEYSHEWDGFGCLCVPNSEEPVEIRFYGADVRIHQGQRWHDGYPRQGFVSFQLHCQPCEYNIWLEQRWECPPDRFEGEPACVYDLHLEQTGGPFNEGCIAEVVASEERGFEDRATVVDIRRPVNNSRKSKPPPIPSGVIATFDAREFYGDPDLLNVRIDDVCGLIIDRIQIEVPACGEPPYGLCDRDWAGDGPPIDTDPNDILRTFQDVDYPTDDPPIEVVREDILKG